MAENITWATNLPDRKKLNVLLMKYQVSFFYEWLLITHKKITHDLNPRTQVCKQSIRHCRFACKFFFYKGIHANYVQISHNLSIQTSFQISVRSVSECNQMRRGERCKPQYKCDEFTQSTNDRDTGYISCLSTKVWTPPSFDHHEFWELYKR